MMKTGSECCKLPLITTEEEDDDEEEEETTVRL